MKREIISHDSGWPIEHRTGLCNGRFVESPSISSVVNKLVQKDDYHTQFIYTDNTQLLCKA